MELETRLARTARWLIQNQEAWKRMCRNESAMAMPAEEEAEESAKLLKELLHEGYDELYMIFMSLRNSASVLPEPTDAKLVGMIEWIKRNRQAWLRMCRHEEATPLPLEEELQEASTMLVSLHTGGYQEMVLVYLLFNANVIGEALLRYLLGQLSEPDQVGELDAALEKITETLKNRLNTGEPPVCGA